MKLLLYSVIVMRHTLQELDFVGANVVMALIADFMLVWLPAPTLSYAAAAAGSKLNLLGKLFAGCPDNAFQKVQPGMPAFSLMQRLGAPLRNGLKLAAVGFGASMIGVGITNALIALRQVGRQPARLDRSIGRGPW